MHGVQYLMNCECWTLPIHSQDVFLNVGSCLTAQHVWKDDTDNMSSNLHSQPVTDTQSVSHGAKIPPESKFAHKAIILKIHTKPNTPSGVINIICLHCPCEFEE